VRKRGGGGPIVRPHRIEVEGAQAVAIPVFARPAPLRSGAAFTSARNLRCGGRAPKPNCNSEGRTNVPSANKKRVPPYSSTIKAMSQRCHMRDRGSCWQVFKERQ